MLVRTFDRPMGLAVDARRLMIGTRDRIWSLRNAPDIALVMVVFMCIYSFSYRVC